MLSMEGLLPGWATLLAVTLMCRDVALGNDRLQVGRLSIECATMSPATVGRDPVVEGHFSLVQGLVLHRSIKFRLSHGVTWCSFHGPPWSESAQALGVYRYKYRTAD